MTRSQLVTDNVRSGRVPAVRAAGTRRPASRLPVVRYCDAPSRSVRGGAPRRPVVPAPRRAPEALDRAVRLTRRGRLLVVVVAAVLLLAVFSLGRTTSNAGTNDQAPQRTVVIQSGETLWQLASRVAPGTDPRVTVDRILRLNELDRADLVRTGQQLRLPG
ncbi:MAG: LysM domain-containing protein [Mycobacteriales bacterium]